MTEQRQDREVPVTDEEWRRILTPEQFHILREKGTERAGTGEYAFTKDRGMYRCAGCGAELFSSDTKFESGTGWPSFYQPIRDGAITLHRDRSFGMTRVEATCARCGGHLGHVFDDGPRPTGQRFCMNSASLSLDADDA
jgi:peptide-methionine (R)-S-oxide reductase